MRSILQYLYPVIFEFKCIICIMFMITVSFLLGFDYDFVLVRKRLLVRSISGLVCLLYFVPQVSVFRVHTSGQPDLSWVLILNNFEFVKIVKTFSLLNCVCGAQSCNKSHLFLSMHFNQFCTYRTIMSISLKISILWIP